MTERRVCLGDVILARSVGGEKLAVITQLGPESLITLFLLNLPNGKLGCTPGGTLGTEDVLGVTGNRYSTDEIIQMWKDWLVSQGATNFPDNFGWTLDPGTSDNVCLRLEFPNLREN